jgi:hypothetical protein
MTLPYPASPNDPGETKLPAVHVPKPQPIHEPIPVEPVHPELPGPSVPPGPEEPPKAPDVASSSAN